jgi:hypothetical protein
MHRTRRWRSRSKANVTGAGSVILIAFGDMKPEVIASHRALFCVLVGLFGLLQVVSVLVHWSVDPRRGSPLDDAAGITGICSFVGLLILWWLLRKGASGLASICLVTALLGLVGSMLLAIP